MPCLHHWKWQYLDQKQLSPSTPHTGTFFMTLSTLLKQSAYCIGQEAAVGYKATYGDDGDDDDDRKIRVVVMMVLMVVRIVGMDILVRGVVVMKILSPPENKKQQQQHSTCNELC